MVQSLILFTEDIVCMAMHFIKVGITVYSLDYMKCDISGMGCYTFETVYQVKE